MTTFIVRFDTSGSGVRLAVKDLIDMEGVPTTAGSRAVADEATPAAADAACLAGARRVGARIVGRTNLHELGFGVTGVNPWFGTPVNPLDPTLVPGGSSSGSAVAVATGEADVAYGTDSGGSVRIPSACCGSAGLKTTAGRVPLDGVRPLAPSLDTVGPMARDVAGLVVGMRLLEPGFEMAPRRSLTVGRLRVDGDPAVLAAVDRALAATGWEVVELDVPGWQEATAAAGTLLVAEAWQSNGLLLAEHPDGLGGDVAERLRLGAAVAAAAVGRCRSLRWRWHDALSDLFGRVDVLATPTLTIFPPKLDAGTELLTGRCTLPVNLAGVPAVVVPVPSDGPLPASLQIVGPGDGEGMLLAAAADVEEAVAGGS